MYSLLTRANAQLSFTLWVLSGVTIACFLSTVFLDYSTSASVAVKDIRVRRVNDYASDKDSVDHATMKMTINADFSKVFNWNVKQLFVYLVAEYSTVENSVNQVVVWDRIVERSNRVVLDERDINTKYYFMDDGRGLLNHENVTFVLRYNVIPNVGYLRLAQAEDITVVKFPTEYTTKRR